MQCTNAAATSRPRRYGGQLDFTHPNPEQYAQKRRTKPYLIRCANSLTVMSELFVLCMLREGQPVPLFSITTLIHGGITTVACAVVASFAKRMFRWGNKKRWRRRNRGGRIHPLRRLWRRITSTSFGLRVRQGGSRKPASDTSTQPTPAKLQTTAKWLSGPSANRKFVNIPARLQWIRFTCAWSSIITLFLFANISVLSFSVGFSEIGFNLLVIAWLAGLVFTWLVVEPAEVAAMVLLPKLFAGERIQACRAKLKDLGIYG